MVLKDSIWPVILNEYIEKAFHKMKNQIPTFFKFNETVSEKSEKRRATLESKRLRKITEDYHQSQLDLQQLQRQFIETPKENKTEREKLKKAIIEQNSIVKKREDVFNKSIGDEDLKDFEI
jgi:hypothetical protein